MIWSKKARQWQNLALFLSFRFKVLALSAWNESRYGPEKNPYLGTLPLFNFLYLTGLDPAGPLFKRAKVNKRLDASHAVFVDAIHTDTRLLRLEKVLGLPVHFTVFATGTNMRMAKSDFYPNDGYHQPGCKRITFGKYLLIRMCIQTAMPCFK